MKSKQYALLFCTFLWFSQASAQKEFELGFNSTNLVRNVIGFVGENGLSSEPYTLSLRLASEGSAIRFGIGGAYKTRNNQEFSTGVLNNQTSNLALSIGYEVRKQIAPKLRYFYGAEGIYSSSKENNDFRGNFGSIITTTNTANKSYILSPFFGVQFEINNWMAISTKSRLVLELSEDMKETFDRPNAIHKGPNYTVNHHLQHILPNAIFLYFNLSEIPSLKRK
jgi:hypothetical protein